MTVIVRAYNAEKCIDKVVNSVLNSMYEGLIEIITCYDLGSKDHTLDVIKKVIANSNHYSNRVVRLIMHEHTTPFHALLECGFTNATGRFITILDYDNLFPPRHIEKMVRKAIETNKNFLFTRLYRFEDKSLKVIDSLQVPENPCDINNLIRRNYIDGNTIFIDRSCLSIIVNKLRKLNHRLYDLVHEDWLIALLGLRHCKCFFNNDSYVFYRIHSSNLTGIGKEDYRAKVFRLIKDVVTLMAFYELEKDTLTQHEINVLEQSLFERLYALSKTLEKMHEKATPISISSKLLSISLRLSRLINNILLRFY